MLTQLVEKLRASRGIAHKCDIREVVATLGVEGFGGGNAVAVGDDCAAIADGDGYLLLAIEGFISEFVASDPWFAGWCGVMVNVSDIYAMGGRPIAVVDAIWDKDNASMRPILQGLASAAGTYATPVVGGHSNVRAGSAQLAVAVLGRARALLTSFDACAGDVLLAVIDLRGEYRAPYLHWNAATKAPAARLRADLELLPQLAEDGLCKAAKDISQAGVLGTLLMLLECSGVGAGIDIDAVPCPEGIDREDWLLATFPSFGFLLAVAPEHVETVLARFSARGISGAAIGSCDVSAGLRLRQGDLELEAWNLRVQPVLGCGIGLGAQPIDPPKGQPISGRAPLNPEGAQLCLQ